jgi:hypothetical protein
VKVDFRCSRTLSAGMASVSSTSKLVCGVFSSCYSRWSRRLPLQSITFFITEDNLNEAGRSKVTHITFLSLDYSAAEDASEAVLKTYFLLMIVHDKYVFYLIGKVN